MAEIVRGMGLPELLARHAIVFLAKRGNRAAD
jgi:hypothetical protein